ncbi:MAG: hypothetical protein AAGJ37_02105 [Pseudomonadota bacterium]
MHIYRLVHAGSQVSVRSKDYGVEVNTRADFPFFALNFCGERTATEVKRCLDAGSGFLTTFYGDCYFYRCGRRYLANYMHDPHTCFLAYAEKTRVFAVLDGEGWPVTTSLAESNTQMIPQYALVEHDSNVISLFR